MDQLLFLLAAVYVAGRVGGEIAERLRQPAVVGEITAGIIAGPAVLGIVPEHQEVLEAMAELGVIFLLFTVGLETSVRELRRVGGIAASVAVGGVVLPFVLGWGLMTLLGRAPAEALFVGTAMVATSVGVTARVLRDRGRIGTREARVILGAAVIDDVLALLVLAVVSAGVQGGISVSSLAILALETLGFFALLGVAGRRMMRRVLPWLARLRATDPVLGAAIGIALVLAAAAAKVGLAAIVGAFLAGLLLSEVGGEHQLEEKMHPIASLLVPFFFVHVGTLVRLEDLTSPGAAGLVAGVTVLAIAGKVVGAGLPALRLGRRSAAIVGVGMVPRGEVGIIVASLGLSLGVIGPELYGVVVLMSLLTTVVAPPVLVRLPPPPEETDLRPVERARGGGHEQGGRTERPGP